MSSTTRPVRSSLCQEKAVVVGSGRASRIRGRHMSCGIGTGAGEENTCLGECLPCVSVYVRVRVCRESTCVGLGTRCSPPPVTVPYLCSLTEGSNGVPSISHSKLVLIRSTMGTPVCQLPVEGSPAHWHREQRSSHWPKSSVGKTALTSVLWSCITPRVSETGRGQT